MSEIIETYQQEQEQLGKTELPQMAFATVVSVNNDGLELIFDGETEASTKRFPCNTGVSFAAGQRVLLMKVNGSYVALCPVGLQGGGGGGYLTPEDVVDSLTSTATDKPLSANQGRVLNENIPAVDDNLTSTSTTHALSANQGRVLNGKIKTLDKSNKTVNVSSVAAQSGYSSHTSIPNGAIGVSAYINNTKLAVSAYISGSYCYYSVCNVSTSSQSGTIYFTFTTAT